MEQPTHAVELKNFQSIDFPVPLIFYVRDKKGKNLLRVSKFDTLSPTALQHQTGKEKATFTSLPYFITEI